MNNSMSSYQDELSDAIASIELLGEEEVFDLTEPVTSHFVANGLVVHNCSEFVFLDDTACNLASINLMKFVQEDASFDIEGYRHANRVFFLAQEILVELGVLPDREDRQPLVRVPAAGSRLRQSRHAAHGAGAAIRQRLRPRLRRVPHRHHDGRGLRAVGRDGGEQGPVRRLHT